MIGTLVQRLTESLSPVTSPVSSPRVSRRRIKSPARDGPLRTAPAQRARRHRHKQTDLYRDVQSEPETDDIVTCRKTLDKRKCKSRERGLEISAPIILVDHQDCVGLPEPPPRAPPRSSRRDAFYVNRSQENLLWNCSPHHQEQTYWTNQAFPPLAGSKSLGRLDGIKEVQRLLHYEQYLEQLLSAQRDEQEELARSRTKTKEAVKSEQSDLERIQDLFPGDALRLYDRDPLTMRMKALIRKRTTTAARLTRALSAKRIDSNADVGSTTLPKERPPKRVFLLENPVQFTSGVQSQDRHLFLFNDLLLVAKARSGGNFKLKENVRVSEIWLTRCSLEDVSEVKKSQETSFVMGWPTTNVVATFSTQAMRDLWWNKLNEVVSLEREKEPRSTNIQVRFNDVSTGIEYVKTFSVGPHDTAARCIAMALQHLEMRGRDPEGFQLWAKTTGEEAPYPLIGHERPFAIKLSCLRQGLSTEEGFDLDHCNNLHGPDPYTRCQFMLRNRPGLTEDLEPKKERKKLRKSPIRIKQVFRRSLHKDGNEPVGCLFGLPLDTIFDRDLPPKPVMAMLQQIFQKGPFTQGIFRKSASARLVKDLREQLDAGADVVMDVVPVLVTAALLKDFLRSLPAPLLGSALGTQWLDALVAATSLQERIARLKMLVAQLPVKNQTLLAYFLCVLQGIARRASQNLMTAANLGVCVGPSLVAPCLTPQATKAVPLLVETLVNQCDVIMGPHVRHLLGEPPERPPDSGAEESDSLHSGGLRRDDSSIDSLEREMVEPPRKDKISLSRDSGLTMSDSQLYTPDEEETSSSSSGSGRGFSNPGRQTYLTHNKVSASYSVPASAPAPAIPTLAPSALSNGPEYVRVYGGWEARMQGCCYQGGVYDNSRRNGNPHFQRQDWFRQRSTQRRPRNTHSTPPPDADRYDSSTLSDDDDSTPHVSRSNSRGKDDERLVHAAPATVTSSAPPLPPKRAPLRHLLPVHVETQDENRPPERLGRLRKRELAHKALAHRSKSLPPVEGHVRPSNKSSMDSPPPPYRPPPRAPPARILGDHQEESYV